MIVCVVAFGALSVLASAGFAAANSGTIREEVLSSGTVGCELSKNLFESTQNLIQGNVGLIVGLIMLLAGFWALINGAAIVPSMATIIMGGLITALPTLINSGFTSLGEMMSSELGGAKYNTNVQCAAEQSRRCGRTSTGVECKDVYTYNGQILQ